MELCHDGRKNFEKLFADDQGREMDTEGAYESGQRRVETFQGRPDLGKLPSLPDKMIQTLRTT